MVRTRKILRDPPNRNYFLIDANFLANKFIPVRSITDPNEKLIVEKSQAWWQEIDAQLSKKKAVIYIPDICIAEAFKVLARKYYSHKYFKTAASHKVARDKMSAFLRIPTKTLKLSARDIKVHDISTCRDIIIAIDRFHEMYLKRKLKVSTVDLMIMATAKYLTDFYFIPKNDLYVITLDLDLWKGSKHLTDIQTAFNPGAPSESAELVFQ